MPILDAGHDFPHPVEADAAWSESYYFNAYDPSSDSGFFTRIGVRANEGTIDVGLSLWLPGSEIGEYRSIRELEGRTDPELRVGSARYEMLEPMRSWRITFDGEVEARTASEVSSEPHRLPARLHATFAALTPAVGTEGRSAPRSDAAAASASTVGRGHLEQAGRWSGTLEVKGKTHRWGDARGNRDRSWGPRRWGGPLMWRWFSVNVGDDAHFGGIRIGTPAGDIHRGWVFDGRETTSIREWRIQTETGPDGLTHRRTKVVAVDKRGRQHELLAEIMRVASNRPPGRQRRSTVVNEGLARWHYRGNTGYGIAEYLHQLDDAGRPVVAVE